MRCLTLTLVTMLVAGALAGCGEMEPPTGFPRIGSDQIGTERDGRIYVENGGAREWAGKTYILQNPDTGQSGLWARVERVDNWQVESEYTEIPYQGGPVEITSEPISGGSTAVVSFRLTYPQEEEKLLSFKIDDSVVITVNSVNSDVEGIHYDVRPDGLPSHFSVRPH